MDFQKYEWSAGQRHQYLRGGVTRGTALPVFSILPSHLDKSPRNSMLLQDDTLSFDICGASLTVVGVAEGNKSTYHGAIA